jgi:hypothetical protein
MLLIVDCIVCCAFLWLCNPMWYAECVGYCISRLVLAGDRNKLSWYDWDKSMVFQCGIDMRGD